MSTAKRQSRGAQRGITLLEFCIAIVLLSIVFMSVGFTTRQASDTYSSAQHESELISKALRAMDTVAEELMEADRQTLVTPLIETEFGATLVRYQKSEGYVGGAVVLGPEAEFHWELDEGEVGDGLDNDGDGLVDEGIVVRILAPGTPTERRTVIARYVAPYLEGELPNGNDDNGNGLVDERGFTLSFEGEALVIRLTLMRPDKDARAVTKTVETAVVLRN